MRQKQVLVITIFLLVFGLIGVQAQTSVNATGGTVLSDGGSVSYSVGQVVNTTNKGTGGSVSQGVQHPFDISVVASIDEARGVFLSAFPNPATDFLTLRIEEFDALNVSYFLYDKQGKLLQKGKMTSSQTTISMSSFNPDTYFVKVNQGNKELKMFNVIKK